MLLLWRSVSTSCGNGIQMQWLFRFSLAIVYTVQVMRWKETKIKKKWQDVADLIELPIGRRSLARPVASPHWWEDVSETLSLRMLSPGGYAPPHTKSTEEPGHWQTSEDASRTQEPWQPGTEAADQKVLENKGVGLKWCTVHRILY